LNYGGGKRGILGGGVAEAGNAVDPAICCGRYTSTSHSGI